MPIAMPPPDIDPTVVPPTSTELTESETRETGVGTEAAPGKEPMPADGLHTLWVSANRRLR